MARLPAGTAPTPHNTRLKRYRAELEARGGRRVIVDLEPPGAQALAALVERDGGSIKDAITAALVKAAQEPL